MPIIADVNSNMLKWARESIGMSMEDAAKRAGTKRERIAEWEKGSSKPTMGQARSLAEAYGRPLAAMYLESPPQDFGVIREFRRTAENEGGSLPAPLQLLVTQLWERQVWARDYLQSMDATAVDFIGAYSVADKPAEVAAELSKTLLAGKRDILSDYRKRLNLWVSSVESAGVFVAQTSHFGKIAIEDARGFALVDDVAPYIFVNAADSLAGRLFTLLHEIGHVALGTSAISPAALPGPGAPTQRVERFCDRFASHVLIPEQRLQAELAKFGSQASVLEMVQTIAARLCASPLAVATRLRQKRRITEGDYDSVFDATMTALGQRKEASGGDYYKARPYQVSKRFILIVADAYQRQQILGNHLSSLTGIKLNNFDRVLSESRKAS